MSLDSSSPIQKTFTDPIEFAKNEADKIESSLDQLVITGKETLEFYKDFEKTGRQIDKTVKILKRSIKGEKDADRLAQINTLLENIKATYQRTFEQIAQSQTTDKALKKTQTERIHQASKVLSTIDSVKGRVSKKLELLENKLKFQQQKEIQRFDHWIEKQKVKDPENIQVYEQLQGVIEKIQLKNKPLESTDLLLLKQIQMGNSNKPNPASYLLDFVAAYEEGMKKYRELAETFKKNHMSSTSQTFLKVDSQGRIDRETALFLLKFKKLIDNGKLPIPDQAHLFTLSEQDLNLFRDFYRLIDRKGGEFKNEEGPFHTFYDYLVLMSDQELVEFVNGHLSENSIPIDSSDIPDQASFLKELNGGVDFTFDGWQNLLKRQQERQECIQVLHLMNAAYALQRKESGNIDEIINQLESLNSETNIQVDNGIMRAGFLLPGYVESFRHVAGSLPYNLAIDEQPAFNNFIDGAITEIEAAKARKIALLKDLNKDFNLELQKNPELSEEQKIKYLIWCRQVVDNPFEPLIEIQDLLNEGSFTPVLKELILLNRNVPIPHTPATVRYKLEGLQRLRKKALESPSQKPENILISGAGPGGLMLGLITSIQGKDFQIIESRGKDDPMRENIVALGKEDDPSNLKMLTAVESHGTHNQADLKLLDFFGVTDLLVSNGKAHLKEGAWHFDAKIKDLQEAMIQQMKEVVEKPVEQVIHYHTEIATVEKTKEGDLAKVQFKPSQKARMQTEAELATMEPTIVYVMEGYRTTTRDLLGIDVSKESKAARMAFSFFEAQEAKTVREKIVNGFKLVTNVLKSIPWLLKLGWNLKRNSNNKEIEQIFKSLDRAALLLKTPQSDYFYFTMSDSEEKEIKEFEEQLKIAQQAREDWYKALQTILKETEEDYNKGATKDPAVSSAFSRLQKLFSQHSKFPDDETLRKNLFIDLETVMHTLPQSSLNQNNEKKLATFKKEQKRIESEIIEIDKSLKKVSKEIAKKGQRRFQLILALSGESPMRATQYKETRAAYSQVQRADANYRQVGNTLFYVGGDAETTTDPASGSGFRTTLLRAAIASQAFKNSQKAQNPFEQSVFEWSSNLSARSMREEGLHYRGLYISKTERVERYLNLAQDAGVLSDKDSNFLLQMLSKLKIKEGMEADEEISFEFSNEELTKIKEIQDQIRQKYFAAADSQYNLKSFLEETLDPDNMEIISRRVEETGITPNELKVFRKVWRAAMDGQAIEMSSEVERNDFSKAIAKFALFRIQDAPNQYYLPEAWFVSLSVYLDSLTGGK